MFSSKKKSQPVELATLVGRDTEIHGSIVFRGALHVDGRVKGNITAVEGNDEALLTIGENGVVEGDVWAPRIVLDGTVVGTIHSTQILELEVHARVSGNLHYHRLEMAMGAEVNGQLIPERDVAPAAEGSGEQTAINNS